MRLLLVLSAIFYFADGNPYPQNVPNHVDIANQMAMKNWPKWSELMSRYSNQNFEDGKNFVMVSSTVFYSGPFERSKPVDDQTKTLLNEPSAKIQPANVHTQTLSNGPYHEPYPKIVIRAMDKDISSHIAWDDWDKWNEIFSKYFTQDMIYDTNYFDGTNKVMGNGTGIRSWYDREHIPLNQAMDNETFNQVIFAADEEHATTTTYAIAPWTKASFFGVKAPNKVIRYRIFDFYKMRDGKIWYNWMVLDSIHMMFEAGYNVLPKNLNPLKQGWVRPPNAMDGIPAPDSRLVNPQDSIASKKIALEAMYHDLLSGENGPSPLWRKDMVWYGCHGFGVAENINDYNKYFLYPISTAFTDKRIELDVMVCEGTICGAHGYLVGKFVKPLLGEKPSNSETRLRFGLHWNVDVEAKRIIEGYGIFDLPGFFAQAGIDLFKRAHDMQKAKNALP